MLVFKGTPNFESPGDVGGNNVYNVTVIATDNSANMAEKDVTVSVKNMQEHGSIQLSALQPQDGTPLRAMLSDKDGGVTGVVWQWYRSSTAPEQVTFDSAPTVNTDQDLTNNVDVEGWLDPNATDPDEEDGDVPQVTGNEEEGVWVPIDTPEAETATYTPDAHRTNPNASELEKYLMVRAIYTDNGPTPRNPVYMRTMNTVQNADPNNQAPWYADPSSRQRSVEEGSMSGRPVGAPVSGRDADDDDENLLTYWLGGPDMSHFDIDMPTGQIKTKSALNYEGRTLYNVTVTVRDPSWDPTDRATDPDTSDSIDVEITVTNVDEPPNFVTKPVFVQGDRTPSFPEGGAGTVSDYDAGGSLAGGAVWSLTGADASSFNIDGQGMLTFVTTPDFEVKSTYEVTVVVTSNGNSDSLPVTVSVGNMDEMGTVTLWMGTTDVTGDSPQVGETITGLVVDPDNPDGTGITVESWQWSRSDSMTGTFVDIPGATMAAYMVTSDDAEMYLRVAAMYADAEGPNKPAYYVTAMVGGTGTTTPPMPGDFDPLVYDTAAEGGDGDGEISKDEAIRAVQDFFRQEITRDQVLMVVQAYFDSLRN